MKWEYKTVTIDKMVRLNNEKYAGRTVEEECNHLGEDGWELVVGQSYRRGENYPHLILIFKRPKE